MSKTLNLAERLLAYGQELQRLGVTGKAEHIFTKLASFRDLPPRIACAIQAHLGELALENRRFAVARRHLGVALAFDPNNAHYHFLLATATNVDKRLGPQQALKHYRRSLRLDPNDPQSLTDYGLSALKLGHDKAGLAALGRALELAPDDPELVAEIVDGMWRQRRFSEARDIARLALFRNPRNPHFHEVWNDLRFREAQSTQERARQKRRASPPSTGARLLPFLSSAVGS